MKTRVEMEQTKKKERKLLPLWQNQDTLKINVGSRRRKTKKRNLDQQKTTLLCIWEMHQLSKSKAKGH